MKDLLDEERQGLALAPWMFNIYTRRRIIYDNTKRSLFNGTVGGPTSVINSSVLGCVEAGEI